MSNALLCQVIHVGHDALLDEFPGGTSTIGVGPAMKPILPVHAVETHEMPSSTAAVALSGLFHITWLMPQLEALSKR